MAVTIETEDVQDPTLDDTYTFDTVGYAVRLDRGLKLFILGIPSFISKYLDLESIPPFVTDFGKGRVFFVIQFIINEGSLAANEEELMVLSAFIRNNCHKAHHCWLSIGDQIKSQGEILTDDSKGEEGKVMRLMARFTAPDERLFCTIQFAQCVELDILGG